MAKGHKILLVEDEASLVELYLDLLESAGYEVETAQDGNRALRLMSKGGYDLILLDIRLPKKDGLEILTELKKNPPKIKNKKIVVTSNLDSNDIIKQMGKFGIYKSLIKSSLTPDQFLAEVSSILEAK